MQQAQEEIHDILTRQSLFLSSATILQDLSQDTPVFISPKFFKDNIMTKR
jgi:hypothetical protein